MRFKKFLTLSVVLLLVEASSAWGRNPCKQGTPLLKLVNNSDAVVIIEKDSRLRISGLGRSKEVQIRARFVDFIKAPIVSNYDPAVLQTVYLEAAEPRKVWAQKQYFAFLTYLGRNAWRAEKCAYLPIERRRLVRYACTAISDLFGDRPYERERFCLLNYPPSANLADLRREVQKVAFDGQQFTETAKFARNGRWVPNLDYQFIAFELDIQARKAFFAAKRRVDDFPIKAYLKTETLSRNKFEKYVRKGVRFKFYGTWVKGNFVIDSIDWIAGRRPRG